MTETVTARTVSLERAARELGIARNTAYALAQRGEFPVTPVRAGKRYLIPREPLERLLAGEIGPHRAA